MPIFHAASIYLTFHCSALGFVFILPAPVIRLNWRPVKRRPAVELIAHHRRFNRRQRSIETALSRIPHGAVAIIKLTILTSFLSCSHQKPHFLQYLPFYRIFLRFAQNTILSIASPYSTYNFSFAPFTRESTALTPLLSLLRPPKNGHQDISPARTAQNAQNLMKPCF